MILYENILPFSLLRGILLHAVFYYFLVYLNNFQKHNIYYSIYIIFIFLFSCFPIIRNEDIKDLDILCLPIAIMFHNAYLKNILGEKNLSKRGYRYINTTNIALLTFILIAGASYKFLGSTKYKIVLTYGFPMLIGVYIPFYKYLFTSKISIIKGYAFASLLLVCSILYLCIIALYDYDSIHSYFIYPVGFFYLSVFIQGLIIRFLTPKFILLQEVFDLNNQFMIAQKSKELNELKISSLRSQMNPHFLFNSLNSMTSIVIKGDLDRIKTFIYNFTNLINNVLDSTETREHRLVRELRTIKNYVELEKLRISGGFDFIIDVNSNVDIRNTYVPPLVIQPYVENAIWHGILKSDKKPKKIKLSIFQFNNDLIIEIRDNGVGLEKALTLTKLKKHKSLGTSINLDRIAMAYSEFDIQTLDIIPENNEWSTLVRVVLKSKTELVNEW